jgi:hypothetical protein
MWNDPTILFIIEALRRAEQEVEFLPLTVLISSIRETVPVLAISAMKQNEVLEVKLRGLASCLACLTPKRNGPSTNRTGVFVRSSSQSGHSGEEHFLYRPEITFHRRSKL